MNSYSPLRYPGGKAKIYDQVKNIIKSNFTNPPIYVEAFAGGSSLALKLLFKEIVSEIHINDLDNSIYAFWYSIKYHKNEFISKINTAILTIDEWKIQKSIYKSTDNVSLLDKGFATFYLNRTNRSGVLASGPIGGHSQTGNYKMDCRFNKINLITLIEKIYLQIEKIHIYNEDAKIFISKIDQAYNNAFIYLDPPYVNQGPNLYLNHFNESDHKELKTAVSNLNNKWLVTYDNVNLINDIYSDYRRDLFEIKYSMAIKRTENEIAIYSNSLIL